MPGKTWEPTKRGARDLEQHVRKGTVVYTVSEHMDWGLGSEKTYSTHEFTHRSPITNKWMTGHLTAATLLAQSGTVYEQPPAKMRGIHEPAPQVVGPLGNGDVEGLLDEAELRGLDKLNRDSRSSYLRRYARRP